MGLHGLEQGYLYFTKINIVTEHTFIVGVELSSVILSHYIFEHNLTLKKQ
jgi:hypothetical protein